jgi:hypothetical protein
MLRSLLMIMTLVAIAAGGVGCDPSSCRGSLTESGCAATFEVQRRQGWPPGTPTRCALAGACGSYQVWTSPGDYVSQTCVYDGAGSLIAASSCGDLAVCGDKTYCRTSGANFDLSKTCEVQQLPATCAPDAGSGN